MPLPPQLAHSHHIPLIVDNTFGMGGWLVRPLALGANIIVASATMWIGGHGTKIGGVVGDGGEFFASFFFQPSFLVLLQFRLQLRIAKQVPDPAEGYHRLAFSEAFGAETFAVRVRVENTPASPLDAALPRPRDEPIRRLQGIETLSLRAARHCENAAALAQALLANPHVAWVSYLGLPAHPSHQRALTTLRRGAFGGVLNFGVKGNAAKASKVVDLLKLASNLANLGDAKTLVIHPASTTHGLLSEDEQRVSGVEPDLIRVSVGIEDIGDIIADFENALKIAFKFDDV
ncbi:Cys/Met metabolism PLP-dependent enzyme-domain-containing protein [Mycena rebaudengoi]|nr:Cys/Met metabolism PLP-dependent enzyme-domain-containing protein [Mycena rebaudengoi]